MEHFAYYYGNAAAFPKISIMFLAQEFKLVFLTLFSLAQRQTHIANKHKITREIGLCPEIRFKLHQ